MQEDTFVRIKDFYNVQSVKNFKGIWNQFASVLYNSFIMQTTKLQLEEEEVKKIKYKAKILELNESIGFDNKVIAQSDYRNYSEGSEFNKRRHQ
jgi:hypothetical protein